MKTSETLRRSLSILIFGSWSIACLLVGSYGWSQSENGLNEKLTGTEPYVAPRELMVLKTGVGKVWGQWIVAVINRGSTAGESIKFKVHIPKEALDFQAAEGIDKKDVVLEKDGVYVTKAFPPGVHVVSLTFMLPASGGAASLTLTAGRAIPELLVMTPAGLLELKSSQLVHQGYDMQDGERYRVMALNSPLKLGDELSMRVLGVPEGRRNLWILAGAVLLLIAIGAAIFTRRELKLASRGHSI